MAEYVDENYVVYAENGSDGTFRLKLFCVNPAANLGEYLKKELSVNQGVYEKLRVQESERTKERSAEILHMIKRAEDMLDRYF